MKNRNKRAGFVFMNNNNYPQVGRGADYVFELFRIVKREFNIPYAMMGRAEHVDEKLAKILRDTGCVRFHVGVECGNEEFRKEYLNRYMSNAELLSAFALLKDAGIRTISNNMIGFPFDYDRRLTKETIEFNLTLRPSYANFNIFYPYPGTRLHQYCVENDLIDPVKQKTYTRDQDSILRGVKVKKTMLNAIRFLNSCHPLY